MRNFPPIYTLLLLALIVGFLGCNKTANEADVLTPEQFAKHVSEILVDGTDFSFLPDTQSFEQDGSYLYDFPTKEKGWFYARSVVEVTSEDSNPISALFAISHAAGEIKVLLNGSIIYENQTSEDGHFNHVDYGLFEWQDNVALDLPTGKHELGIVFNPKSTDNQRIYIGLVSTDNALPLPEVEIHGPERSEGFEDIGYWWIGPFPNNDFQDILLDVQLGPNDLIAQEFENNLRWDKPRIHLVKKLPGWLTYQNWHYSTGTFLDAMSLASAQFESLDYTNYINEHLDFFLNQIDAIEAMRNDYGLIESPFGHYFRYSLLDDVGMQTVPYASRLINAKDAGNLNTDSKEYELVSGVVNHFMNDASRLEDGTYARFTPDTMSVWADDLFMGSIVLLKMAELTDNEIYLNEVVNQVNAFDGYLRDEASNLYWHGWFSKEGKNSSSKWGRANGWTMMTKTELLLAMPENHPERQKVLANFVRHCEGLLKVQSEDGRWHQVLDNPSTYLETSATAMFLRAFAVGIVEGWLDEAQYKEPLERGWAALTKQINEKGDVVGIVRGTPIMFSDQEYADWGDRRNDPRGLGALIYAAVAMDQYLNR